MRKKQKAARDYVQGVVKGMMIDDDINTGDIEEAFIAGADWQSKQPITQEKIDESLFRFISSVSAEDKVRLGHYILTALSGIAIDVNSAKTTLSTEFTHKGKRYEARMLITQKEV